MVRAMPNFLWIDRMSAMSSVLREGLFRTCACAVLLVGFLAGTVTASPALTLSAGGDRMRVVGTDMELLVDGEGEFDLARILRGEAESRFFRGTVTVPVFPATQGSVWARFRMHNPGPEAVQRVVVVEFANFRRMVFHSPDGEGYRSRVLDTHQHQRDTDAGYRYPAYTIEVPAGATPTYYVEIRSHSARFPVTVWRNEALERFALQEFWLQGLLFGIVLCVLGYQIALTLLARESEHWSLALAVAVTGLTLLCMLGYQHVYLGWMGDWLTRIYSMLLCGMAFSVVLFSRHFLELKARLPLLDRVLRVVQWACIWVGVMIPVAPHWNVFAFSAVMLVGVSALAVAVGMLAWRRAVNGWLYLVSFAPVVATGMLATLVNSHLLPMPLHYHTLVAAGFSLGILMFAFSSAYRVGQVRREQRALRLGKQHAEDRSRLQAEFLANMSHEVRTPLNAVMGMLELAARDSKEPEQRRRLEVALRSSEVLLGLFNQALDFARIEAAPLHIEPVRFSPAEVISEIEEIIGGQARDKRLFFECTADPGLPACVVGDRDKLKQVALNLVSNAIKFTGEGRVSLRAMVAHSEGERVQLRIEVEDTGIGIAESAQARLFQRFVQADESIRQRFGGTGLGLAICRALVEGMQGRIGVNSQEGKGSTFWLEVPLVACAASPALEPSPVAPVPGSWPLKLLIVDDNAINRELIEAMLVADGHCVEVAEDGVQALSKVGTDAFDAVFMDVSMPVMDGVEATRQIRALGNPARRAVPIIGLTAHAVPEKIESFLDAGMDDVLTKPVRIDALRAALSGIRVRSEFDARQSVMATVCQETLDSLRIHLGGERLDSLLERQFEEARQAIAVIRSRLAAGQPEELARTAHRLVGAFGLLGLHGPERTSREIEAACHAGNSADLPALLGELAAQVDVLQPELAKVR